VQYLFSLLLAYALFLLFSLSSTGCVMGDLKREMNNVDYDKPYPGSKEELLSKVLGLLAIRDGNFEKEDVERVFGVELHQFDMGGKVAWKAEPGKNWYFYLVKSPHDFLFGWDVNSLAKPPKDMCIPLREIDSYIDVSRWDYFIRPPSDIMHFPNTKVLIRKDGMIRMYVMYSMYEESCVSSIQIQDRF